MKLLTLIFHVLMAITIILGVVWVVAAAFKWMPPMVALILLALLAYGAFGEVVTAKKELNEDE